MKRKLFAVALIVLAIAGFAFAAGFDGNSLFFKDSNNADYLITPPGGATTMVGTTTTQTLTNKTLTSPTITGASLSTSAFTYTILDKTTDYTVLSTDAGKVITNAGSGGAITLTLPEASTVIGKEFTFVVSDVQTMNIDVATGDIIVPTTNAAGDKVWADALGESITLVAIDAANFVVKALSGTWTDGN